MWNSTRARESAYELSVTCNRLLRKGDGGQSGRRPGVAARSRHTRVMLVLLGAHDRAACRHPAASTVKRASRARA